MEAAQTFYEFINSNSIIPKVFRKDPSISILLYCRNFHRLYIKTRVSLSLSLSYDSVIHLLLLYVLKMRVQQLRKNSCDVRFM